MAIMEVGTCEGISGGSCLRPQQTVLQLGSGHQQEKEKNAFLRDDGKGKKNTGATWSKVCL